jgi:hypothetical protein
MKSSLLFAAACLGLVPFNLPAATTHYVDVGGTNAVSPYTNWVNAATSIQDAIDASTNGDTVLVTNGIYRTGGRVVSGVTNAFSGPYLPGTDPTVPGPQTNRVAVTKAIILQSVNGPKWTIIEGAQRVRCAYLTNGATLTGFTLTNGLAESGGGAWCLSDHALVSNCIVVNNQAAEGGGVFSGAVENCILLNNHAIYAGGGALASTLNNSVLTGNVAAGGGGGSGGGASFCVLNSCTVVSNIASAFGSGVSGGTLNNCIVYNNQFGYVDNYDIYYYPTFNYCCTAPMPTSGVGNITNDPAFVDLANGDLHLQAISPCINTGNNSYVTNANDLDGNARIVGGTVDMGAYEYETPIRCVNINNTTPAAPYTSWFIAATNIQDAVDAAENGDFVLVNDGIYQNGFQTTIQTAIGTNRVVVDKPVTVQSLNGPSAAFINGGGIYRCVYLTNGAMLSGFTLTNGAAGWSSLGQLIHDNGAGINGATRTYGNPIGSGVASNCVLAGNSATGYGGGAYGVTLINCTLTGNFAQNGGGAASSTLVNCIVTSNSTPMPDSGLWEFVGEGGGIYHSDAINCVIANNRAWEGGGASGGTRLINCTIVSNTAGFEGGLSQSLGLVTNCIIYYNSAGTNANYGGSSTIVQSCTTPMPTSGQGNITNAPAFLDLANGDYHVAPDSLLINSGLNSAITNSTDLDGNPRIVGGTVDIGAYEYQSPTSVLSYAWARQYGFPTDGSTDCADPDHDGMSNWQEFLAGTNPTNANSVLAMTSAYPYNNTYFNWHWAIVKWQSVSTRTYYLLRSSDLGSGFACIQSNIVGNSGTTIYNDTTATNNVLYFYRVGVQ